MKKYLKKYGHGWSDGHRTKITGKERRIRKIQKWELQVCQKQVKIIKASLSGCSTLAILFPMYVFSTFRFSSRDFLLVLHLRGHGNWLRQGQCVHFVGKNLKAETELADLSWILWTYTTDESSDLCSDLHMPTREHTHMQHTHIHTHSRACIYTVRKKLKMIKICLNYSTHKIILVIHSTTKHSILMNKYTLSLCMYNITDIHTHTYIWYISYIYISDNYQKIGITHYPFFPISNKWFLNCQQSTIMS